MFLWKNQDFMHLDTQSSIYSLTKDFHTFIKKKKKTETFTQERPKKKKASWTATKTYQKKKPKNKINN